MCDEFSRDSEKLLSHFCASCISVTGPSSAAMKVRDVLRLLLDDGWYLARSRGSHHQYKHPTKTGRVTVPGSGNDDLAPGTLNSILKQAGLQLPAQE